MNETVLVTGANGFLGTQVIRCLLKETGFQIIALVRGNNPPDARRRLNRAWWDWPELRKALGKKVEILTGDMVLPQLGLSDDTYQRLVQELTHIIHTAADLRLAGPIEELRAVNVWGTTQLVELARAAHRDHGVVRFTQVSTAYVAGKRTGTISEDSLTDRFGFHNGYEQTKYQGERVVQAIKNELPVTMVRPGMIVGDSRNGQIKNFNTLYYLLRLHLNGKLKILPASPQQRVNLIPVDVVAEAIIRLTLDPRATGGTYHVTLPVESQPTVRELVTFVRSWARERLSLSLPPLVFLPVSPALFLSLLSLFPGRSKRDKSSFMLLLPYFENRQFQRDHTDQLLGIESPSWRDFLPRLLDYAVFHGFLHRSERTVHEQVLFRLGRTHRPVVCSDIVDGKITRRHSKDLQREILAVTASLQMWGIRPGDRVALIGGNSTRYLTVDVAIGLAGGVSVPLYLTSPWEEIDVLLSASGARFLFMGDRNHFPQGREMRNDLPVVFFGRGSIPPGLTGKVISWEEFLDLGKGNSEVVSSPAEFGDIATIRYSSGTTGEPKGVMFRHHQLRWMAETIAALPPWKVRNHPVFYLSFLPLNHVVEGILGAYSPFYAPAPVNLFFLEDLHDLIRALPQVRPTLFFSVPRFYEKWWEIIQKKLVTNWFLRFQPGVVRQLLALFIRWFALRKAGLDRCVQFIAGSAPFREDLLQNFHALGIEIHNAYGLTEAPLLTINRVDRNRIGTVGEPLPETEISIAADGEIRGRGPQVTTGYFGQEGDSCLRDGWLLTGDIGNLTDEGFLVITGRKKDLLITSYGKNIYPMKIESMLRALPGVAEGILVGEGKPYCVALLWVDNPDLDPTWKDNLERLIPDINAGLSCPEQVKRWAVLSSPLSIEKGELTANLKLKRSVILTRYRPVIEALYEEREVADNVLFLGKIPDE